MINIVKKHKGFFVLFLGGGASKGLSILSYPIISRMFDSTDFALYSIYSSILSVACIYSSGRYFNALYNSDYRNEDTILSSCLYSMCFLSLFLLFLVVIVFFCSDDYIIYLKDIPFFYIMIIPFLCMFSAILDVSRVLWIRDGEYKYVSYLMSIIIFSMLFFQIVFGYLKINYALFIGVILSNLIGAIYCITFSKKSLFRIFLFSKRNFFNTIKYMKDNLDYPLFNGLFALVSTFSLFCILYLIEKHYGLQIVGVFAMATKLVKLPISFFSSSILEYLSNKIINAKLSVSVFLFRWGGVMLFITIFYVLIIMMLYPIIIPFFLGDRWSEVGQLSKFIVFPITFTTLVLGFFMQIGTVKNIQKFISIISILSELILVFALICFHVDFYLMLTYYNIVYGVFIFFFLAFLILKKNYFQHFV